jgi:hypothetical protein
LGRTASQTAAHRLGQILGLLVIPIVVLWSIYFYNAKADIDALSREIAGAGIALVIVDPNGDLDGLAALENVIALKGRRPIGSNKSSIETDELTRFEQQKLYLQDVYRASGLALDGNAQSNALAETTLVLLPTFNQKIELLMRKIEPFVRQPSSNFYCLRLVKPTRLQRALMKICLNRTKA